MALTKFETVDGYGMIDVAGAPLAVGPVRSAKKVLQRTTGDLIRHATYALAVHGIEGAGAAAALNLDRAAAEGGEFERFAAELEGWAGQANFRPIATLGLSPDEAGPAMHVSAASAAALTAASAVASIIDVGNAIIVSDADEADLVAELDTTGAEHRRAESIEEALATAGATVFVRGGTGTLHHEALTDVAARAVVGLQALTTTARGLAFASRNGSVIVPDFVSAGGPVVAATESGADADAQLDHVRSATRSVAERLADAGPDAFVAACEMAEAHLRTWTDELPFGRPLAP